MVSQVNLYSTATCRRWYLLDIDLRFAPGLPSGWYDSRTIASLEEVPTFSKTLNRQAGGVATRRAIRFRFL